MQQPVSWGGIAYNQATESENKIHADDVAKRYGFRGGLVPGVTVYAYLVHPAVEAWGLEWVAGGSANVVLAKPLYDEGAFRVEAESEGESIYRGRVIDADGVLCAEGHVSLPSTVAPVPERRGDALLPPGDKRPQATRAVLEELRERGMGALELDWTCSGEFDRYTRDLAPMPDLVRPDGQGYAHAAFTLGLANWALVANVRLGPWIHVQSEVNNHAAIPRGSKLYVEASVVDLFERGGHEFADLDVAVFIAPDVPAMSTRHRAIYKLRDT